MPSPIPPILAVDMPLGEFEQHRAPENMLSATVVETYALLFKLVRPLVRKAYQDLPQTDFLLRRSKYLQLADLIRYQSELLAKVFVEHYYRTADQSGAFVVDLPEIEEVARCSVLRWTITDENIHDIADERLRQKNPGRSERPSWMPAMNPIIDMAREIRHLANNALAARAIERKPIAQDLSAERVTDPAVAESLWQARQGVYRAVDIALAIKRYKQEGDVEPYKKIWKKVGEEGAFLERYAIDKIRERVANQAEWVIFRAKGRPVILETRSIGTADAPKMLETLRIDDFRWGSDVQIQIPLDDPQAPFPFSLQAPPEGDFVYRKGQRVADLVQKNHGIAGCVSDLRVSDDFAHMGFAGAARFDAFHYIKNVINSRRKNKLRFLIAEIFSVHGLYLPEWKEKGNEAFLPLETPLSNIASQIAHTHGRTPAFDGWDRTGDRVPVWLPEDSPDKPHYLDVSWTAMIHDLELAEGNFSGR